jgi:hypothetical protein
MEMPQTPSPVTGRAEGLESTEFAPPPATIGGSSVLEDFEAGEFTAPSTSIAPLAGLEDTSLGDAVALPPAPPTPPSREEFAIPDASAGYRKTPASRPSVPTDWRGMPTLDEPEAPRAEPAPEIPAELPPAVIAAEAELVYLVSPEEVPAEASRGESASSQPAPAAFVTETMAELFVKQGFREQALDVYRQLLAANPGDERLRAKVAALQPAPAAYNGPTVREFFARLATLRPRARSAAAAPPSADDFASFDAVPAAVPSAPPPQPSAQVPAPRGTTPGMASAVERAATTQTRPSGSIDALFGNRAVGTSEDSAASALAQAFGGGEDASAISGRPAHAASKELSLDSVFRDGGARARRPSGSFSFDQFFSEGSSGGSEKPSSPPSGSHDVVAPAEPAERTADDISQFNSWLQGLKHR